MSNEPINFFDTKASEYLSRSFNLLLRSAIIEELIGEPTGKRILDIGCGDGSLTLQFSISNAVTLVDGAPAMIEACRRNLRRFGSAENTKIIQSSIEEYRPDGTFDIIVCFGVLAHVGQTDKLFENIVRAMGQDAVLLLQFSDRTHFRYRKVDEAADAEAYGYKLKRVSPKDVEQILLDFDLQVIDAASYPWSFRGLDRLPQRSQFWTLNKIRKTSILQFLSSEHILLIKKQ